MIHPDRFWLCLALLLATACGQAPEPEPTPAPVAYCVQHVGNAQVVVPCKKGDVEPDGVVTHGNGQP